MNFKVKVSDLTEKDLAELKAHTERKKKVEELYNKMFGKYYSDESLSNWFPITFFGGGNSEKYKTRIYELLKEGKSVKTGYRTSKMVRGHKTLYIFWKDKKK